MTIRLTPRARDDLENILGYVEQHDAEAADRVRRAIASTLQMIEARPHIGIRNVKIAGLRSRLVSGYPYRIHYVAKASEVRIVHNRHSARRPWTPNV